MNKSLVLGSEGLIGRHLCDYLTKQNENFVGIDIKNSEHQDLRTKKLNLYDITHVYFLAWNVGGAKYLYREDTQISQTKWNTQLLYNVMMQLEKSSARFIFISSQLSDDNTMSYGIIKRMGELWARSLNGIVVRLWNVYGPEDVSETSHVMADFIHQAFTTNKIEMLTDGAEQRQFSYVEDVVKDLYYIMHNEPPKTYDVASGIWTHIIEIAELISLLTGCKVCPGNAKGYNNPVDPINLYQSTCHTSLFDGLKKVIEKYNNEYN